MRCLQTAYKKAYLENASDWMKLSGNLLKLPQNRHTEAFQKMPPTRFRGISEKCLLIDSLSRRFLKIASMPSTRIEPVRQIERAGASCMYCRAATAHVFTVDCRAVRCAKRDSTVQDGRSGESRRRAAAAMYEKCTDERGSNSGFPRHLSDCIQVLPVRELTLQPV